MISSNNSSSSSYGIYNYRAGSVTIGTKDGAIDKTSPIIGEDIVNNIKSKYGIQNSSTGKIYFYDGTLKGTTKAIEGTITEIEENSSLSDDITTATELYLVQEQGNQVRIGTTEYLTLQQAIDSCNTGETIELLRNVLLLEADSPITVPEGKDITIEMTGKNILSSIKEVTWQNSGNVTLKNSSGTASNIQTISAIGIQNIGSLVIENCNVDNTGSGVAIQNEGTLEVKEGTIQSRNNNAIRNLDGTAILQNGTIGGIQNEQGTVVQNGGTIIAPYNYTAAVNNEEGQVSILAGSVEGSIITTGSVTIGSKDGKIDTNSPIIRECYHSTYYAITNNGGQLYLYDGIIKGKTKAISGEITEIEDRAELLTGNETIDGSEYETLQLQETEGSAVAMGETNYATLQQAIDACPDGTQTTIKVLRDTVVTKAQIPSTKDIILDINGKVVTNYQVLTNQGNLQIIDNSGLDTGKITASRTPTIQNNGTMQLVSGNISDNVSKTSSNEAGIVNNGTFTMKGGNIQNNEYGIYNSGTVSIENGNIQGNTTGIYTNNDVTISGGNINSNTTGVQAGGGITTITAGTFDSNTNGTYASFGGGTIIVNNATFTNNQNANYCDGSSARITIVDGTFTNNQYGAYCKAGQVFVGIKDTNMNATTPTIVGEVAGVKVESGGILHFFDGKIQGKQAGIQGYASFLEDGYKVKSEVVDGYDTATLALSGTVQTVARVGDVEFSNLQSAINSCIGDTAQTVTLVNTVTITESIHISADQKVILDLNKHSIEGDIAGGSIIDNAGELTILDSSIEKTGGIKNTSGVAIHNTGTLTLGIDDGNIEEVAKVEGGTKGIETSGTFNYYDGTIKATTPVDGSITSLPAGKLIRTRTEDGKTVYYIGE